MTTSKSGSSARPGVGFDVMADHGDDQGDKAAAAKTPVS